MRKIRFGSILVFNCLLILAIFIAVVVTRFFFVRFPLGDFTGVLYTLMFVILLYLSSILIYRIFLMIFPLQSEEIKQGSKQEIKEGSKQEFVYHIYLLFYLLLFNSLIRSKFISVSLMRIVYLMLGARLGENTYSAGTILDPPLIVVGSNTLLGQDCVLYSHIIEGKKLAIAPIHIGSNVTIGANAVIMPGVTIEDDVIIAAGAVVTKGQKITSQEVWGGIPAKKIKNLAQ